MNGTWNHIFLKIHFTPFSERLKVRVNTLSKSENMSHVRTPSPREICEGLGESRYRNKGESHGRWIFLSIQCVVQTFLVLFERRKFSYMFRPNNSFIRSDFLWRRTGGTLVHRRTGPETPVEGLLNVGRDYCDCLLDVRDSGLRLLESSLLQLLWGTWGHGVYSLVWWFSP